MRLWVPVEVVTEEVWLVALEHVVLFAFEPAVEKRS
jgi:hypothetical protein